MATAATANPQDVSTWAANGGPTDDDKIEFVDKALEELSDTGKKQGFANNVKQVGVWANQIDAAFDNVARTFAGMEAKYEKDFPGFAAYNTEWVGYKNRWVAHLTLSRTVAAQKAALLRRFDEVFLDMVESIASDQDRLEVIAELEQFSKEKNDEKPNEMSKGFLDLKRDIEDFVKRLDQFIEDKGAELAADAKRLKGLIDGLQGEITVLDGKIKDSTIALSVCGACLNLIGAATAGGFLAAYTKERNEKAADLATKQAELVDVKRKQGELANLKTDFAGVKPDIILICEKLLLFAEIWTSVQSQAVQFQEHLQGGMEALGNMRFKKEVRLARKMCTPLQEGLDKYATELENRK